MFRLKKNKLLLIIIIVFLFTRLTKLTQLPVFNDEAIYIYWGSIMTTSPSQLYYSLFDGKQPLMMWLFGYSRYVFSNYLLAGRVVSVIFSALSVGGIYALARFYFTDKRLRIILVIVYMFIPIFLFFDRQALMESALFAVSIWSFYLTVSYLKTCRAIYLFILGAVLGLGIFVKSTAVIYLLLSTAALTGGSFRRKFSGKKILPVIFVPITAFVVLLPLVTQPGSIIILQRSDRFNLTAAELMSFPLNVWLANLTAFLEVSFWHLTPVVFVFAVIGVWVLVQRKVYLPVLWFLGTISVGIFTARGLNARYTAPLLPLAPLVAVFGFSQIHKIKNHLVVSLLTGGGVISLIAVSLLMIFPPLTYFNLINYFTPHYSQKIDYVTGDTSGYGINEAINFLDGKASLTPILVGVRLDAGNPESAILAYYYGSRRVFSSHLDRSMFPSEFDFSTFKTQYPLYFVSRSQHLGGLEQYVVEEARFYKPESKNYIGVYRFNASDF